MISKYGTQFIKMKNKIHTNPTDIYPVAMTLRLGHSMTTKLFNQNKLNSLKNYKIFSIKFIQISARLH